MHGSERETRRDEQERDGLDEERYSDPWYDVMGRPEEAYTRPEALVRQQRERRGREGLPLIVRGW